MPTTIIQAFVALALTIGVTGCVGLPAQPLPDPSDANRMTDMSMRGPSAGQAGPRATTEVGLSENAPSDPAVSTPVLIQHAFDQGEITEGERLLYLAYAVYEYDSLPTQFQSDVGWRGTEFVREIRQATDNPAVMCRLESAVQNELRRVLGSGAICN